MTMTTTTGRGSSRLATRAVPRSQIAQGNATKHATASRVRVDLRQRDGQLFFSVLDDGVGFDPATAVAGTGVQNMKDRVASLGGRLVLESQRGKGTIVSGSVPLAVDLLQESPGDRQLVGGQQPL
jgi:glucose-6-phosphate-specific signal transduction histidine kinase